MTVLEFPPAIDADGFCLAKEYLGSVIVAGVTHAAYPTAHLALCGARIGDLRPNPRGEMPDCPVCLATAFTFDQIDRSAPPPWRAVWA